MPKQRYGRVAILTDASKEWFADRSFEVMKPVDLIGGVHTHYTHTGSSGRMEAEFRVYKAGMQAPKSVIILNGSTQWKSIKLSNWLRVQGEMGFFAVDECGAILYVERCEHCGDAKQMDLQGFVAPKVCQHSGGLIPPTPSKPEFLSGMPILDQIYYVLETGAEADNSYDFVRGRHILDWNEDGVPYYLFSAKHVARHLNLSSLSIREELLKEGSESLNIRRFGKLQRLWNLPQRSPDKRFSWDQVQDEPSLDLPETEVDDAAFWNTQNEE